MRHPVDHGARQRLLEAQRAEADALRKVQIAARGCDAARSRLDVAIAKLLDAQRSLARTSGPARAALLLGVEEAAFRRELRRTDETPSACASSTSPKRQINGEAVADAGPRS